MSEQSLRQFASEIGGRFEAKDNFGGSSTYSVVSKARQLRITFEIKRWYAAGGGTAWSTRIRILYWPHDKFRYDMATREFFTKLWERLFGRLGVESGYADLDALLIIKTNDEAKLRQLLANQRIRQPISALANSGLIFKLKQAASGRAELHFWMGRDPSLATLKSLHELVVETLEELYRMGSISEQAPDEV